MSFPEVMSVHPDFPRQSRDKKFFESDAPLEVSDTFGIELYDELIFHSIFSSAALYR